ncbi:MAG: four helix bundle protein, partial [Planctomycetota bacterium]
MTDAAFTSRFTHQRLDAYRVALELFAGVERLADEFPRGHADHKDQLRRAAAATVRHIAEGANRIHPRDKAARFALARAECGECEATLEMAEVAAVAAPGRVRPLRGRADRVAAMLVGLLRRERARALRLRGTGTVTPFREPP